MKVIVRACYQMVTNDIFEYILAGENLFRYHISYAVRVTTSFSYAPDMSNLREKTHKLITRLLYLECVNEIQ